MRTLLLLLIIAAIVAAVGYYANQYFSAPQAFPDGSIGRVEREETQMDICATAAGNCAAAAVEDSIFIDNMLRTNETGLMRAILIDDTELSLGPNAEIVIDEYVFEPRTVGTFAVSLLTGTMRMFSGRVSDTADSDVRVDTPVAGLGVRGTDFWVRSQDDRLDVLLIDGVVEVTNALGTVVLRNQGDYAYVGGADVAPLLRNDLSRSEMFELLSSTAFDDELEALLDPSNDFRTVGEE